MDDRVCTCPPLPPALWLLEYGLLDPDDRSTRTTDVTDEEIAECLSILMPVRRLDASPVVLRLGNVEVSA
jgi:hypothetical protein